MQSIGAESTPKIVGPESKCCATPIPAPAYRVRVGGVINIEFSMFRIIQNHKKR